MSMEQINIGPQDLIVGKGKLKEKAAKHAKKAFGKLEKREAGFVLEKTEEEKRLIDLVNKESAKIVERHAGRQLFFPENHIYILEPGALQKIGSKFGRGISHGFRKVIKIERLPSIVLTATLLHEMLHAKSYQVAQALGEKNKLKSIVTYRGGFSVVSRDGKTEYFHKIDEAVIEELTIASMEKLKNHELLRMHAEDTEATKEAIANFFRSYLSKVTSESNAETAAKFFKREIFYLSQEKRQEIQKALGSGQSDTEKATLLLKILDFDLDRNLNPEGMYARLAERIKFYNLIDQLYHKNRDRFSAKEEIIGLFFKATFGGNIMPVARLIEKTFGKGSFKKLGKESSRQLD